MLVSVVSYTGPEKYNADVKIKRYITLKIAHKSMSITRRRKTKSLYIII